MKRGCTCDVPQLLLIAGMLFCGTAGIAILIMLYS